MRISDWSSDVCSSDLPNPLTSAVTLLAQFVSRTAIAVLLMLLAVSPAFAGFGSAVDSGSHAVAGASLMTSAATGDFVITHNSSADVQSESQQGKVMPIAFGICAHIYGDLQTDGDASA